jgi:hypothetical protein
MPAQLGADSGGIGPRFRPDMGTGRNKVLCLYAMVAPAGPDSPTNGGSLLEPPRFQGDESARKSPRVEKGPFFRCICTPEHGVAVGKTTESTNDLVMLYGMNRAPQATV